MATAIQAADEASVSERAAETFVSTNAQCTAEPKLFRSTPPEALLIAARQLNAASTIPPGGHVTEMEGAALVPDAVTIVPSCATFLYEMDCAAKLCVELLLVATTVCAPPGALVNSRMARVSAPCVNGLPTADIAAPPKVSAVIVSPLLVALIPRTVARAAAVWDHEPLPAVDDDDQPAPTASNTTGSTCPASSKCLAACIST